MSQSRERFPERAFKFGSLTAPVLTLMYGWGFVLLEDYGLVEFEGIGRALLNILMAIMVSLLVGVIIYPFSAITGGLFLWTMMKAEERFVIAGNPLTWAVVGGLFAFPTASWVGRDYYGQMSLFGWWIVLCGVIGAAVGWWVYYGKTFKLIP